MVGIHFTFNPRVNGHSYTFTEKDLGVMKDWALSRSEFKDNRLAIVEERPGQADAHMHALLEGPDSICPGRQKTQEVARWFQTHKEEFPADWKIGTKAVLVKAMTGKQTMEMTLAGYLRKEDHNVYYSQGFEEEELEKAASTYRGKVCLKLENLVETTFMEKALAYREQKGLETESLSHVLAAMGKDGYSLAYLLRKRKITQTEVVFFSKRCRGQLEAEDIEDMFYAEPPSRPLSPRLQANMCRVIKGDFPMTFE